MNWLNGCALIWY